MPIRSRAHVSVATAGLLLTSAIGWSAATPALAAQAPTAPVRTAVSTQAETAALSRRIPTLLTEWKGLVPGPYAVGFRVTVTTDPTRTIQRSGGFSTGAKPDFGPRPMQVVVWYPAASATGGVPMTYTDYLPLLTWDAGTSREPDAARADAALKYIQAVTPLAGPPVQAEIDRLFGQRVLARKEAEPAPGRFPVLIYAPGYGYPAFDNSVMCEYLASHGYLVVASPSVGPDAKRMTGDALGLEAQIRDLEFLAGQVRSWPQADADRVGTAGYSWGGLTSALFALRYGGVRALISLDGVIRETSSLAVAKSLHYNKPALLRVPTLVVTLSPELSLPDCNDSSFLDQVKYADVTTAVVPGLQHHDLVSLPSLLRRGSAPGQGKDWSAVTAGYVALCRLTRDFLDANLKPAGTAGPSSTRPTAGGLAVSFRKAEKAPPTPDDFRATLDSNGAAPAAELLRLMRRDFPDALAAFQSVVNEAGYELLGGGRFQDAITLFTANAECFPESLNASDSLGEAYLAAGDLDKAEQCYLDVKRKLEESDTLSPAARARYAASTDAALARIKKQRGK
jgi:dienelactone hydrolase